ncbi:MAG: NAD(P)H-hydrate dehydratase [Chitinophagaceae bacterium]
MHQLIPILSAQQQKQADAYTIENKPISSIDLMETAAYACFSYIKEKYTANATFLVFCGLGNNGGDGLAIARMMHLANMPVKVYVVKHHQRMSNDCWVNEQRLCLLNENLISYIETEEAIPAINNNTIIIDALLGTGTNKPATGILLAVINAINKARKTVIAIDLPSGLLADAFTPWQNAVVKSTEVLSFQSPKMAFFAPENAPFVANFSVLPIGILIPPAATIQHWYLQNEVISQWLLTNEKDNRFAYKNSFGHVLLIAGSYGKMGAAILAAKAALRSGAGLATAYIPQCGYQVLQTAVPELMVLTDEAAHALVNFPIPRQNFSAIVIGPGLGTATQTTAAFMQFLSAANSPLVLDADALNILATDTAFLEKLAPNTILTPHIGEFDRLFGQSANQWERWQKQVEAAVKWQIIIVLKGANTCIALPNGTQYFNSTGNEGMATAGSGDVLAGMVGALLARGYAADKAALIAVYMHGLAGDLAAKQLGTIGMIAGDIVEKIPEAFYWMKGK